MAEQLGRVILAGVTYEIERNFGRLPDHIPPGRVSQVAVDRDNNIHVLRRAPIPVVVFKPDGTFVHSYGEGQIFDPHGISRGREDYMMIVDRDGHRVLFFSKEGLSDALGKLHDPHWEAPFNHPTRAAVARNDEIYVADGYGNARIHRFARDGGNGIPMSSWGTVGSGPGQFMTPHSVIVDKQDRVLVVDRENDRVQLFNREGGYLDEWHGLSRPMDFVELDNGLILVTDQVPSVTAFAPDGTRIGRCRPTLNGAHGMAADQEQNIYLAEIDPTCVTKMRRVAAEA